MPNAVDEALTNVISLIVPEAVLVGFACFLFILSTTGATKAWGAAISVIGIILATLFHFIVAIPPELKLTLNPPDLTAFTVAPALIDGMATYIRLSAFIIGLLLLCLSWNEISEDRACDYFACLLCITAGFSLVGKANDLIFLWLALELISIPTYVMLYLPKKEDRIAQEAATKYFLLSIMSSGLLLFGFSYLYGITGTTNIHAMLHIFEGRVMGDVSSMAVIAAVMVLAGLGFRITAFPFHFYAPDVYQGGPSAVVALLAVVPKIAGFAALIRLMSTIGLSQEQAPQFAKSLLILLWVVAAVTMTAGNILALWQDNLRRLLAYSSVAHSGYMLIGIAIIPAGDASQAVDGGSSILFYLVAYAAMTLGVFSVINYLNTPESPVENVDDLAGLHETHPAIAFLMVIFLLSLIGIPLTGGFLGKFYIFLGALSTPPGAMGSWYQVLVLVGAINAAIAAYYYLRIIGVMYLRSSFRPASVIPFNPIIISMVVCAIVTLLLGVYPTPLLMASKGAVATIP